MVIEASLSFFYFLFLFFYNFGVGGGVCTFKSFFSNFWPVLSSLCYTGGAVIIMRCYAR